MKDFVEKMIRISIPTGPVVIGESSSDLMKGRARGESNYAPVIRLRTSDAKGQTYSTTKGFAPGGGLMHGMVLFENDNISYQTYVNGLQIHASLEDELRKAWQDKYEDTECDIFLAQQNNGCAGGVSAPCKKATANLMFLYSHAMDNVEWARKRARGEVTVSENIPKEDDKEKPKKAKKA